MSRPNITNEDIDAVLTALGARLADRLLEKGLGAIVSRHEALGIILEEVHELQDAVRLEGLGCFTDELADTAVACILALVSIDAFEY